MQILELVQGSDEWHKVRLEHCNASEAPMMMGATDNGTRTELLDLKKTGDAKAVSAYVQKYVFDPGHAMEAAARLVLEEELGEDLYPVVARCVTDGIPLLASVDGQTMDGKTLFEHKGWNEELAAMVRSGDLSPKYYWQLEQQLHIFQAEQVIFVVSDGTKDNREILHYTPVSGRLKKLLGGWAQFLDDLGSHEKAAPVVKLEATSIANLPELTLKLSGGVSVSNLEQYKQGALAFIENINTDLQTDQHFVDAKAVVKFCEDAEGKIKSIKDRALSETASIKEAFDALDELGAAMRAKRLTLDKLVKNREAAIKDEIRHGAENDWLTFIAKLNEEIGPRIRMPAIPCDIAAAMKGKRTIASLRDAASTTVANAKIEANDIAALIRANLKTLRELPDNRRALFADAQEIILKPADDFANLVSLRIKKAEDDEAEAKRQQEIRDEQIREEARQQAIRDQEAERERLEQERLAQEQQQAEEDRRRIEAQQVVPADEPAAQDPVISAPGGYADGDAYRQGVDELIGSQPVDEPAATLSNPNKPAKTAMGLGQNTAKRQLVAELVSMESLLLAIIDGVALEDFVMVNQAKVQEFVDANGTPPPGFRLKSVS